MNDEEEEDGEFVEADDDNDFTAEILEGDEVCCPRKSTVITISTMMNVSNKNTFNEEPL